MKPIKLVLLLFLSLLLFNCTLIAQNPEWQWGFGLGGNHGSFIGHAVNDITTDDSSGTVFFCGGIDSLLILGADTIIDTLGSGAFLASFTNTGTKNWIKTIRGSYPWLYRIYYKNGFIYLMGFDYGYIELDTLHKDSIPGHSGNCVYIAKVDRNGIVSWLKHFPYIYNYLKGNLVADSIGNVYFNATFSDTLFIDHDTTICNGSTNACVISLDNSGNFRWKKQFIGSDVLLDDMDISEIGELYVTGGFYDTTIVDTFHIYPKTNREIFLAKFNLAGSIFWIDHSTGSLPGNSLKGAPIVVSKQGLIYEPIALLQTDSAYISTQSSDTLIYAQGLGGLIVCYKPDGNILWTKKIVIQDTINYATDFYDVSSDDDGNGYFTAMLPPWDTTFIDSLALIGVGQLLLKTDSSGNIAWVKSLYDSSCVGFFQMTTIKANKCNEIYGGGQYNCNGCNPHLDSISLYFCGGTEGWFGSLTDPTCFTNGFENLIPSSYVKVYPNPSSGNYYITSPSKIADDSFRVFDVTGRQIYFSFNNTDNYTGVLSIKSSPGIYIIQFIGKSSSTSFKVLKE